MPPQARLDAPGTLYHVIVRGIGQGRRLELVGGGLRRSQGNWSVIKAMARLGMRKKSDEENGLSLAQTARHPGVSTSAIAKLLERIKSKSN
jgi:hypothetical protein